MNNFLRMLRRRNKLSQRQLAYRLKVSQPYVSNIEKLRKMPSNSVIFKLSNVFNICPINIFSIYACQRCKHKKCAYKNKRKM